MANYTIKDLERLSGIKAHTIRIWEKRYGLIEPERTQTNIRLYCDAELKKLLNISVLNRNGYKISKIASLSNEEISDNIQKLSENPTDIESQIENLSIAMIDLDEAKFEKLLSRTIIKFGFEDTIINIINPFLIRIGVMWQTGTINPAQEHFISNLIRQKLLVAIDSQVPNETSASKTFLLFLPEGENHEFGLLFANYILRKRNHRVIYLGQNIPLNDLKDILRIRQFDFIMTSIVTNAKNINVIELINKLQVLAGDIPLLISGSQILSFTDKLSNNQKIINSPQAFISLLDSI